MVLSGILCQGNTGGILRNRKRSIVWSTLEVNLTLLPQSPNSWLSFKTYSSELKYCDFSSVSISHLLEEFRLDNLTRRVAVGHFSTGDVVKKLQSNQTQSEC